MDQPCVSIIIPVFNGAKTINESLDSLLKQDYIEKNFNSVEIIIINDNSTDNSFPLIKDYFHDKTIKNKILSNKKNLGLAANYNRGIEISRGDYVITMHQDVILKENALAKLLSSMDEETTQAAFHYVDHPREIWEKYNFWQKCLFSRLLDKRFYGLDGKFDLFRKSILIDVGMFDTATFRSAGEDGDIVKKIESVGILKKTEAGIIHIHDNNPNYSLKSYLLKHAQLSEAQGALYRKHGITSIIELFRAFFRESLLLMLLVPYLRYISIFLILLYS
ncbi:uncharacterized protein METZ01_LOCUS315470, partial [marine metagenome]